MALATQINRSEAILFHGEARKAIKEFLKDVAEKPDFLKSKYFNDCSQFMLDKMLKTLTYAQRSLQDKNPSEYSDVQDIPEADSICVFDECIESFEFCAPQIPLDTEGYMGVIARAYEELNPSRF